MNTTVGILIILGAGYLLFSGSLDSLTGGTGSIGGGLSPSPVYSEKGAGITDIDVTPDYIPAKTTGTGASSSFEISPEIQRAQTLYSRGYRPTIAGDLRKGTPPAGMTGADWWHEGRDITNTGGGSGSRAGQSGTSTGRLVESGTTLSPGDTGYLRKYDPNLKESQD